MENQNDKTSAKKKSTRENLCDLGLPKISQDTKA
jgi:hypothetical protein